MVPLGLSWQGGRLAGLFIRVSAWRAGVLAGDTVSVSQPASARTALAVGTLGVVFGDIGTSPLYTEQTVFNPGDPHPVKVSGKTSTGSSR